jgi:hypothetical protein
MEASSARCGTSGLPQADQHLHPMLEVADTAWLQRRAADTADARHVCLRKYVLPPFGRGDDGR